MTMAAGQQLLRGGELQGKRILAHRPATARSHSRGVTRCAIGQKADNYDKEWKKGFFGTGYFLEGRKKPDAKYSYLRQLEKKKVLSGVERIKLLSKLEKAGLTLSKLEELKLLSTAESLGALSLVERAFETEPGTIASLSIPPFLASIAALSVIPDDNVALATLKYSLAAVLFGSSTFFVVAAFTLQALNED